jgi:hypothetical protein
VADAGVEAMRTASVRVARYAAQLVKRAVPLNAVAVIDAAE